MENAVIRDSDEWNMIEFSLQLRCRTSRVKLLQAWNIINTESLAMFNRRTKNMSTLDTFINTEDLDYYNSIQDVCTRGFEINSSGFLVSFGNLSLPDFPLLKFENDAATGNLNTNGKLIQSKYSTMSLNTPKLYPDKRIFEYFICDVGLGKSIEVTDIIEAQRSRVSMPIEYDSYFIKNTQDLKLNTLTFFNNHDNDNNIINDDIHSKGILPQYTFKHDYIIYDSSQILARYLIQFECDYQSDELYALPLCDNCHNDVATIYCPSDIARICIKCDVLLHSNNKVVSKHIRVPLSDMPRPMTLCRYHPTKTYHMYCTVCNVPICQLCTSNHIHNKLNDDESCTSFIPIMTAYESSIREMKTTTNIKLIKRKEELNNILNNIENIKNNIYKNCNEIESLCYKKLDESLIKLKNLSNDILEIVLSEQNENKRQLNEIKWSESFVEYMKNILLPPDFLKSWLRHCKLRYQLYNSSYKNKPYDIFPDITLEAQLNIITEDTLPHLIEQTHTNNI